MKQTLGTTAKIGISIALIALLLRFRNIDLGEIGKNLREAHPMFVALAFGLYLGAICLGAYKWQLLLRPLGLHVRLRDLIAYTFVGLFLGNFLPSATISGDAVRAYNLARTSGRPAEVATSVTVDRLIGMLGFMGMAVIMTLVAVFVIRIESLQWLVMPTVIAFTLMVLGFLVLLSARLTRRGGSFFFNLPVLERLRPHARLVFGTLQTYRHNTTTLVSAFLVGLAVQLLTVIVNWLVGVSLNPANPPIDLLYFFLFNPLIGFVPLIPVAFNGIGPTQAAYVFFYGLVGIPEPVSFALSVIMQVIITGSSVPGGVFLWLHRAVRPEGTPLQSR